MAHKTIQNFKLVPNLFAREHQATEYYFDDQEVGSQIQVKQGSTCRLKESVVQAFIIQDQEQPQKIQPQQPQQPQLPPQPSETPFKNKYSQKKRERVKFFTQSRQLEVVQTAQHQSEHNTNNTKEAIDVVSISLFSMSPLPLQYEESIAILTQLRQFYVFLESNNNLLLVLNRMEKGYQVLADPFCNCSSQPIAVIVSNGLFQGKFQSIQYDNERESAKIFTGNKFVNARVEYEKSQKQFQVFLEGSKSPSVRTKYDMLTHVLKMRVMGPLSVLQAAAIYLLLQIHS